MADEPWQEDWGTGGSTSGAPLKITVTPKGGDEPWQEKWDAPSTTIPRAFADIPKEIADEFMSGARKVAKLADNDPTKEGTIGSTLNVGSALLGVPQMAFSPITGAARSLIGHPYADLLHEAGKIIAPEIAAKDDPKELYETGKHAADLAMASLGSRIPGGGGSLGARPTGIVAPPAPPAAPSTSVVAAADRLAEIGAPVEVPRAFASDSMVTQRGGQGIRNVPIVGDAIPKAIDRMVGGLGNAAEVVAGHHGSSSGPNVASRIGRDIREAAATETGAAEAAARRSDEALRNAWRTDVENANAGIARQEAQAGQEARRGVADMTPQEMGQTILERLRATEREAHARKEQLYGRAAETDASIRADEVSNVSAHVGTALREAGVITENTTLTPAANHMMQVIERMSRFDIPHGPAGGGLPAAAGDPGRIVGVTVQAIEQARKELSFLRSGASTDADRRAATLVMRAFDNWQSAAFERALLSGDPNALAAFRNAREANASWRQRFFNDEDEAAKFITKIIEGEVTPQEVANLLVGAGEVGAKGVGSRILTRLTEAVGADAEVMEALRGGILNRLMQNPEGLSPKTPAKIADDIHKFFNTTGSDVARRIFPAPMRERIEAYGETVRRGQEDRSLVADIAKATEPTPTEVPKGPAQQLSDTVVGKGKTDEALFRTIDEYAKSGGRADLQSLAKIVRGMSEENRADLAGAIIRNMGKGEGGAFSPDIFATNWGKKYTPQAKAILFGNAGPMVKALDDIAAISQRFKTIGKRFGNPAGTAQNVNLGALVAWGVAEPFSAISTAVGGSVAAKILSSPVTAQTAAKWSRAYLAASMRKNAQTTAAFQGASRALAEAGRSLGSTASTADFMKLLQAPTGRAGEEQNK